MNSAKGQPKEGSLPPVPHRRDLWRRVPCDSATDPSCISATDGMFRSAKPSVLSDRRSE